MSDINNLIDAQRFYYGIISGAEKIIENSDILNEANGFPVPDRDTGNNLSYLMDYIIRNLEKTNNIKNLAFQLSNAAIKGARGNSGAIFSQFFVGFYYGCPNKESINIKTLILCLKEGYNFAYKAINNPVEGTILTAMSGFVQSLENSYDKKEINYIFNNALIKLKEIVAQTKYKLKAQIKLQSEDAGAKAFLYFVEGFVKTILSDEIKTHKRHSYIKANLPKSIEFSHTFKQDLTYRYCTEILIKKDIKNIRQQLEKKLKKKGDSLVISENENLMRVHVHTNKPGEVAELLSGYGETIETKADDMKAQQNLAQKHEDKVALVIDTVADLPNYMFKDYVFQMPLILMVDKISYQDKRTVFPELLNNKKISSSQPNQEQINSFLNPIVKKYRHVLILTPSSKMSGLYQRYETFCTKEPNKITLIDTKLNSVAQGMVVVKAISLLEKSQDIEYIKRELASTIERSRIYVSLLHLDAMVNSGRLNERVGWFLKKIGFLPLITINDKGEGKIEGIAFSQKQNEKLFLKKAIKEKDNIENYAIVHANDEKRAKHIADKLTKIIGKPPMYIEPISYIVVNFSGVGSVAIGYTLKKESE